MATLFRALLASLCQGRLCVPRRDGGGRPKDEDVPDEEERSLRSRREDEEGLSLFSRRDDLEDL